MPKKPINTLERGLIIPDTHAPYHDQKAIDLVLSVAAEFEFDHLYILGDFADFYQVSAHPKSPDRAESFKAEVASAVSLLETFSKVAPNRHFVSGNHENRLERYLEKNAPELFGFISLEEILELKRLGYTYTPYRSHRNLDRIAFTHDTGTAGRYAHYKAMDTFQGNVVIGHTHRFGWTVEGNAKGESHFGAHLGWLGDSKKADYMHRIKALRDWHLGFGIFYRDPATKLVYLQPTPIINYSCLVEGTLFTI